MTKEMQAAMQAVGYRGDPEKDTVSGVVQGVAFLLSLPAEGRPARLEMSVSIPEKQLPALAKRLEGTYPGITAEPYRYGILLTLPAGWEATGETVPALLDAAAQAALQNVGAAYDERFEDYGEPWFVYLRGAAGALLGALVGALPWLLVGGGWFSVWLGALVSTASFFGYRLLKGAHHTGFATACILVFSFCALLGAELSSYFSLFWGSGSSLGEVLAAIVDYVAAVGLPQFLGSLAAGMAFGLLGLFSIRKYISIYTHEPRYLRRRKEKKKPRDKE